MEEVVASHPDVVECAVVGIQDELKGQVPIALPVLREGCDKSAEEVKAELIASVRDQIGAISSLKKVVFVQRLPKTRSGKTLRKLIRMILDDQPYSIPSTIEDASVIDEITTLLKSKSIN